MAVGAEVVLAAPVVGDDVAGRASSALTILSPLLPCSALRTQVWTAAQPPPGILWPAFSSDHVMNDAHHGLPGATFAAARYSSTCGPRFAPPISRTPSWVWAIFSAAAPSGLPPPPAGSDGRRRLDRGRRPRPPARRGRAALEQPWASASLVW